MKKLYTLLILVLVFGPGIMAQDYTFRYNPYSGMNKAQLELALKQSQKMERNGIIWTAVGSGMMVSGAIMTFQGITDMSYDSNTDYTSFGVGLGLLCVSAFPLGYGLIAWITGSERSNMIEIELLASDHQALSLKPTGDGIGLVLNF